MRFVNWFVRLFVARPAHFRDRGYRLMDADRPYAHQRVDMD